MSEKKKVKINGFVFTDEAEAEQAKKEAHGIHYVEERADMHHPETVLEIYNINSDDIKGAIISSVVPQLVNIIKAAVEKTVGITPLMVGPGIKTGLNILMDQPRQVGTDMIVDAVATLNGYGAPAIIIDMGTATTISVVDEKEN